MSSNKKIFLITLGCLLFSVTCPRPGISRLQWPLKDKTYLTGSFAEFRPSHIHTGIDISTRGKIGLPVYASADGSLSRVKTQIKGFGKTVYIRLADGKFLVYAHLDRFSPKINEIISRAQEKQQRYQVDIYPQEIIPIKQGDIIGYSGSTGGVPPHLHFELRDAEEKPLNILNYGLEITDDICPLITDLAVCSPDTGYYTYCYSAQDLPQTLEIDQGSGLALAVYDPSFGNKLGIYQLDLSVDGKPFFRMKMDTVSYDQFHHNFLAWNKGLYLTRRKAFYNLFILPGNTLPFYPLSGNGILDLSPGPHSVKICARDHSGNQSTLQANIIIKSRKADRKQTVSKGPWLSRDGLCRVIIHPEDMYYPINIAIDVEAMPRLASELVPVSPIYNIQPAGAVFKKAVISTKPKTSTDKTNLYHWENNRWEYKSSGTTRNLGRWALFRDTVPPDIKILSTHPVFRARIEDKGSGLDYDSISLYVDGKKIPAEYSTARKEIFYTLPQGNHKIKCCATDRAGNSAVREFN